MPMNATDLHPVARRDAQQVLAAAQKAQLDMLLRAADRPFTTEEVELLNRFDAIEQAARMKLIPTLTQKVAA